jgi:hypothetical protein
MYHIFSAIYQDLLTPPFHYQSSSVRPSPQHEERGITEIMEHVKGVESQPRALSKKCFSG